MQYATIIFVAADESMMNIQDPDAQYQSVRRVVHEHITMRRINPDIRNLGSNDLAYALRLSTEAVNVAYMCMNITIDMNDIEDPKSRARRMDVELVAAQPQDALTLGDIQLDSYKLLANNFDKAARSCVSSLLTFN